jgi:hypothetical protein
MSLTVNYMVSFNKHTFLLYCTFHLVTVFLQWKIFLQTEILTNSKYFLLLRNLTVYLLHHKNLLMNSILSQLKLRNMFMQPISFSFIFRSIYNPPDCLASLPCMNNCICNLETVKWMLKFVRWGDDLPWWCHPMILCDDRSFSPITNQLSSS